MLFSRQCKSLVSPSPTFFTSISSAAILRIPQGYFWDKTSWHFSKFVWVWCWGTHSSGLFLPPMYVLGLSLFSFVGPQRKAGQNQAAILGANPHPLTMQHSDQLCTALSYLPVGYRQILPNHIHSVLAFCPISLFSVIFCTFIQTILNNLMFSFGTFDYKLREAINPATLSFSFRITASVSWTKKSMVICTLAYGVLWQSRLLTI